MDAQCSEVRNVDCRTTRIRPTHREQPMTTLSWSQQEVFSRCCPPFKLLQSLVRVAAAGFSLLMETENAVKPGDPQEMCMCI